MIFETDQTFNPTVSQNRYHARYIRARCRRKREFRSTPSVLIRGLPRAEECFWFRFVSPNPTMSDIITLKSFKGKLFTQKLFCHATDFSAGTRRDHCVEKFRVLLLRHHQRGRRRSWTAVNDGGRSSSWRQLGWRKSVKIDCRIYNGLVELVRYDGQKLAVGWICWEYRTRELVVVFGESYPCYKWHRRKHPLHNSPLTSYQWSLRPDNTSSGGCICMFTVYLMVIDKSYQH